ncbi:MAG: formyltransferase family protein [Sphingobacteriaceae bacterium]
MNKITFFLMSKKGYECLISLIDNGNVNIIDKVIVSQDENIQNDYFNEITEICRNNKIEVIERNNSYSTNSKYLIAISWRWLIKHNENQCLIVFHDSILPKYRGFAPLVTSLINKESEIGVTALIASNEYDKGDIISQSKIAINYPIKVSEAIDRISFCYIEILNEIIFEVKKNATLKAAKQKEINASYSIWLDEDDYKINWNDSAENIKRFIDSVGYPYNGAKSLLNNSTIRIFDASVYKDVFIENRHPGKVIFIENDKPIVICGKGLLLINDAVDDISRKKIIPLKNFRSKFK